MNALIKNTAGKKMIMAVTGQAMTVFIILHVLGNATLYFDSLNEYADKLHAIPLLLWAHRAFLLILFLVHVTVGIQLYLVNRAAKPDSYAIKTYRSATFAGETMIWTGLLIGIFLVYHLLHFTLQVTDPGISSRMNTDALGRPDVLNMVIQSFRQLYISVIYLFSLGALLLHLSHGIQSSFQSLGINNEHTLPFFVRAGSLLAYIICAAFASIPALIFIGIVKG